MNDSSPPHWDDTSVSACPPLMHCVAEAMRNTPLVSLDRLVSRLGLRGRVLAKLEYLTPGHSKKDRAARQIILEARRCGALRQGQPVVELTSGNMGTGLAICCRALGHRFIAVMSKGNTPERARMMAALGAEVVLVDQAPGAAPHQVSGADLALVEARTRQIVQACDGFRADQFNLQANVLAHRCHTGPELWHQSLGAIDAFVDFVGTGGCFTGVMQYLRSVKPAVRGYVVEPAEAPALAGGPILRASHRIQGGGYARATLPLLDRSMVTDYLGITDDQAVEMARLLACEEGIFGGYSSGANLAAAVRLLRDREAGTTVAMLVCDSGLKYLSTDLYTE